MELQTNRYVFNNACRRCDSAAGTFCGTVGGDVPAFVQELPDDDPSFSWPSQCPCCRCCGANRWNSCCCCNRCHCSQNY